ncbi:MAG TPA: aldo/keto reductase [Pyrinomonadaceae bacterium]|jgi:aryl-alcohol dehydrogenase-like predicted oxidoreductase|nr:aldo/keto reductase [Pyrinomonadaceae bacterium]
MQTRQLGTTGLSITPLGFGSWAVGGGGWQFGWGSQDDRESIAAINRALDLGVNWIDTAAVYGLGHSEEIVAKALRGHTERPYIFTKCSMIWDAQGRISHSLKRESIRREVEQSLRRLKVDVIDLYQIHWPSPDIDIEEGWSTLSELKREGKVRYIGASNFGVEQLQRAMKIDRVDSLQPPYSLIHPEVEDEVLPFCERNGIGVIVYSPMMSGLLSGRMTQERISNFPEDDWRKNNPEFQEPRLYRNLWLTELLKNIGRHHGVSAGEIAIAWTLRLSAVIGAIVGGRSPDQVDGIVGAANFRLSEDEIDGIDRFARANVWVKSEVAA